MRRRDALRGTAGLLAGAGLAGCLGGDPAPPPRESRVFEDVSIADATLQIELVSQPFVESRKDVGASGALDSKRGGSTVDLGAALGALSPIGVASAQKGGGGRGATGRGAGGYRSAPTGRHGWAVWHGSDDDDEWRENHAQEIEEYPADVDRIGVEYLGRESEYEDDPPGPGYVPEGKVWDDPEPGTELTARLAAVSPTDGPAEGWYRVGVHLVHAEGTADFGWQGADLEVDNEGSWIVDKAWHVKPRL
ncbi:hypothetical protein RYH80_15590 [Halobaculum sp. MBLA0147]|uniref:hypothetical protein n=1 Tax=Halobaculum sp. MBLA0147 TaxID=3079934 RepID=UPI00352641F5